jgi:hypothetical protein
MALQLPSGPINYGVDIPDPSQAFLSAFKTGTAITEARMAQEQAQRQAEQQKLISQAFQRLRQPGATAKDYADLAMMLPETQAKAVRESFSMINAEQQQNALGQAGQVFSAFKAGKPEIAIGLIERQIEAKRNSGDEQGARFLETWRDVAKENPKAAEDYFGFTISQIPGGDKVIAGAVQLEEDRRKTQLQPLELEAKRREGVPTSIQEAIDFRNLKPEQQATFRDLQVLKKPPAAVTNVNVTNLEKTASGELAKLLPDLYEQANSAASQISDIPRYRKALESAITGPFAEQRLSATRVANALGFTGDKSINATTELIQGNAEMALRSRSLMTGQGQITEGEQKLLIKARAGDINFTKGELQTLFNVFERASRAQYQRSTNLMRSAAGKSETAQMFLDNVTPLPGEEQPQPQAQPAAGAANIRSQADAIIRGGR